MEVVAVRAGAGGAAGNLRERRHAAVRHALVARADVPRRAAVAACVVAGDGVPALVVALPGIRRLT